MKRFIFCIIFILVFPSLLFSLEVRFKNEAVVDAPMLTLADVAMISPFSKSEILSDLALFPAPSAGERKCFSSSTLKAYVLDAVTNKESIRWAGAETVCVYHEGVFTGSNEIQSAINAAAQKALRHLSPQRVVFEARNLPETSPFHSDRVEYEVLFSDRDVLKSRQVNVIVRVDGQVRENLTIAGRLKAFLPVVVTRAKLSRGSVIEQDQVETEVKNIAELTDPCLDFSEVIGKRVKRPIAINQVISEHDLDLPILIERKQMVTMILQKGALQISTKGMASTDGKLGDVIQVKNMKSHREIPCLIIGPGLTKVEF
jgi:flagella basal body P-ring formation protein FlgA